MKKFLILGFTCLIIVFGLTSYLTRPKTTIVSKNNSLLKGEIGVIKKKIVFSSNGNQIYGRALIPTSKKNVPTVIFSHGFGGNHEQEETLQENLAKSGIAVYSFDFSGGTGYEPGKSEGKMVNMSVLTEKQNLKDAITTIKKQDFVDQKQIYLIGASQGGVVTTLTAEELKNQIAGVVLLYPAFSLFEDARSRFSSEEAIPKTTNLMGLTVGSKYFKDIYNMDIYKHMTYSGKVNIFHGDADNLVNISYSKRAVKTFPNASLTTVKDGTHGFSTKDQELISPSIVRFIKGD